MLRLIKYYLGMIVMILITYSILITVVYFTAWVWNAGTN